MSAPALRKYQLDLVCDVRAAYQAGYKAPLVVLSTGGGKTTIFAYVTASASNRGKCVFLLAHRAELVKQIAATLAAFECPHQVVAPGPIVRQVMAEQFRKIGRTWVSAQSKVYVCSVQTLVKRVAAMKAAGIVPDIIVIDEAHHLTNASQWGQVASEYPTAKLLPVTATPIRLDGKGLGVEAGGFADTMVRGPTMRWLIENGFLSPYRIFAPPNALDLTGVRTRAGDFAKDQLAEAIDKPSITGDSVEHYQRLAPGKRAVAFCVSVAHAEHVAAEFRKAGIPAESLDGTQDAVERDAKVKRFEAGETLVLASADLISEGFDLPAIEVVILLRPTQSLSLYLQQVGRGLRIFPGKREAIILDHVGAVVTHGLPDHEHEWSLDGAIKTERQAKEADEEDVQVMKCPRCFAMHAPAPECPCCGWTYPIRLREPQKAEGELVELGQDHMEAMRRQRRVLQGQAQTIDDLVAQGIPRSRAKHIIAGREAKQELIDAIMAGIDAVREATGEGPYKAFGTTMAEVRKAKPKDLKALLARIQAREAELKRAA